MDGLPPEPRVPIDAALWARLKRLDRRCLITLARRAPFTPEWKRAIRVWCVSLHDQEGMAWDTVHVERPRLSEALRVAIEEAEKRGWAGKV